MVDCQIGITSKWVRSEEGRETQQRVWDELLGGLEGVEPGIVSNLDR